MSKKTSFYVRQFSGLTQKQLQETQSFFVERNSRLKSNNEQLEALEQLLNKKAA